jgi:flagellar biosynthesis protein FlhB
MSEPQGEKIHPPTPRRRQQARQQGQVARSRDLVAAGVLLAGLAVAWMRGGDLTQWLGGLAVEQLGGDARVSADADFAADLGRQTLFRLGVVILPALGVLLLAAIASQVGQFGVLYLPEKLAPDMQRLSPAAGWRRIWAADNWVRTGFGLLKLLAVLSVAAWSLWSLRHEVLGLGAGDARTMAAGTVALFSIVAFRLLLAVLGLAVADYVYQRWHFERELWMTEEQRREDSRDEQTDPQIERRRRQRRREISHQQVDREIARADVVLIAGSSLAVALKYDPAAMTAPRVLAKGTGQTAAEIYRVAQHHGRWIVDQRKLTRELYRRVPAGQELPTDMYRAVAGVLAELPRYKTD